MSAPMLDRACAAAVLALVDAAKVHAPGAELAWLVGWAMRAAGETVAPSPYPPRPERHDPRSEPEQGSGAPVARVSLSQRPKPV